MQGDRLLQEAEKLGVDITEKRMGSVSTVKASDAVLQHRVMRAKEHLRQNKLFMVAIISAVAAIVSAIAAWMPWLLRLLRA